MADESGRKKKLSVPVRVQLFKVDDQWLKENHIPPHLAIRECIHEDCEESRRLRARRVAERGH